MHGFEKPGIVLVSTTMTSLPTLFIMLDGYLAALLMGMTLGIVGAGGSILTVPILVYLFQIDPILATAYSLFLVGATALVGAIGYAKENLIDYRTACFFGFPSVVGVFVVRRWGVSNLPDEILGLTKGSFVLSIFALVMIMAAITMIRSTKNNSLPGAEPRSFIGASAAIIEGLLVGVITGFVGAGGGFLIVPALVFFLRLPVRTAIGTSLCIIAVKSLLGFCGDLGSSQTIDWSFLLQFTLISSLGIAIGTGLGGKVPADRLKVGFGWFVLLTGAVIIFVETS